MEIEPTAMIDPIALAALLPFLPVAFVTALPGLASLSGFATYLLF